MEKQRVLEATDLVRLVMESVSLKRKGKEYAGLCPFHDDRTPSMFVSPQKQIYKCFSCGAGGDAFSWMMNYAKMSFPESLEFLAERAGIKLTPRQIVRSDTDDGSPSASREEIARANQVACEFFRLILAHETHGASARVIVKKRGISEGMVDSFMLGAAPDKWDGLLQLIQKKNLELRPFLAAGLIKSRDSGSGYYDGFRNRLMFPITNTLGQVIAFGARKINEADEPKYLNSPESALFNKSATLYALPQAASAIRKEDRAVVVEGYMDAIACHQAGVTNVVATLGTALTGLGGRVLQRQCQRVVLLFDGDAAGQKAADRAVEVLFDSTLDVRIATMTQAAALGSPAKDPDELVKQPGGTDLLRKIIDAGVDALDYRFSRLRDAASTMGMQAKAKLIEEEITRLVELGLARLSPVHRQMVVKRIATLAGVGEEAVRQAIAKAKPRDRRERDDAGQRELVKPIGPRELALACVLHSPELWADLDASSRKYLLPELFDREAIMPIARAFHEASVGGNGPELRAVLSRLSDESSTQAAVNLAAAVDVTTAHSDDVSLVKRMLDDCLGTLAKEAERAAKLAAMKKSITTRPSAPLPKP